MRHMIGLLVFVGAASAGYSQPTRPPAVATSQTVAERAELYQRIAGGRGHFQVVGSTKDVVDLMEEWFTTEAADGFNVIPPFFPNSLDEFNALVVPELQRRGLYRTAYEGKTLRENLGLPRPASRYARSSTKREAAE